MKELVSVFLLSLSPPITPYGHQSYAQETVSILRPTGNPLVRSLYNI